MQVNIAGGDLLGSAWESQSATVGFAGRDGGARRAAVPPGAARLSIQGSWSQSPTTRAWDGGGLGNSAGS